MPGTESVRVVVRVRPLNSDETRRGCASVVDVDRSQSQVSIFSNRGTQPKTFAFDAVYDPLSEQQQIYDETGFPLVENVLEGYNGTIFAYGQTGCGKTFTMSGTPEKPGVIPNSFKHIFGAISDTDSSKFFLVYCSFIEIYNEEIRDLLKYDPKSKLELKENADKGVYVKGVTKESVNTIHDINKFMEAGASHRTTKETMMNERSSRSHSIFTVYIEMSEVVEERTLVKAGKLNLVDLAGSERQKKTQATGDRLKEAIEINLSLSALGNVISALVDGQSTHIPYRDSKLTRLLQDSLGGNTKTIMIAVTSPADYNYDESLSTLRYASRAKFIQNKPKINEDPKDTLLREYLEEINRLKKILADREGGQPMIVEKVVERIVEKQVEVKVPYYIENQSSSAQVSTLGKKQSKIQLNSEGSDGLKQPRSRPNELKPGSEGKMLKDRLKPKVRVLEDDEEDSDQELKATKTQQEKRLVQKGLDDDSEEELQGVPQVAKKKQENLRGRDQPGVVDAFPKQKGQIQHKREEARLESDSEEYPDEGFEEEDENPLRKEEEKEPKAKPAARTNKGKKASSGPRGAKTEKGGVSSSSKPAGSEQSSMRSSGYDESAPPLSPVGQKSVENVKAKNAKIGSKGIKSGGPGISNIEERKISQAGSKDSGQRLIAPSQPQSGYGSVRSSAQGDSPSPSNPDTRKPLGGTQGKQPFAKQGKSGNDKKEVLQLEDDESDQYEEEANYDEDFEMDQPGMKGEKESGRKMGQRKKTEEPRAIQLVGKKAKNKPHRSQSQEDLEENEEYAEDFEEVDHASKQPEKRIGQVESTSKLVSKPTEKDGKSKKTVPKTEKPSNPRKPEKPTQKSSSKEVDDDQFPSQKQVLPKGKKPTEKQSSDQYVEDEKSSDEFEESVEEKETRISMIKEKLMKGGQIPEQEELARLKEYRRAQLKRQKVSQVEKKPDKRGTEEEQLLADRQYQSLNEEVEDQRKVVKGLRLKFKSAMAEIQDLNHEHEVEKEDLLEGIRSKDRETGFLYQVLEKLLSSEQLNLIKQKSKFDDENNEWTVPPFLLQKNKQTVFPKLPRRQAQEMVDAELKWKSLKFQEEEEDENGLRNAKFQDWKKSEDRDRRRVESQPGSEAERPSSRGFPGGGNLKAVLLDPLEKAPVAVVLDGTETQLLNSPPSRKRLLVPIPYDSSRGMAVSDEFPKAGKRSYIS